MTGSISDRARIVAEAKRVGFDAVGVTPATGDPRWADDLHRFIEAGRHGTMAWLPEKADRRRAPDALWPEARSVIMLGLNYGPDEDPREATRHKDRAAISVYARHRDYHDVVKKKLKELAGWIHRTMKCEVKVFVDTAPVLEKPLAARAGLGWAGKHTNLVSRDLGSWFFLGAIYTTLDLAPDDPHRDHCGACRACLDACPTGALTGVREMDARRCISYLTIEHAGPVPEQYREKLGNRIYGCDDCLAVCPWNKFAKEASEAKLVAREDLKSPALADLVTLDDPAFRALFSGSPIKRIGRDRFIRNVLYAIGNSGDPELIERARPLADDPSDIVRDAARWALDRKGP